MRYIFTFFLALPALCFAHPGIGIVKDTRGAIYYTDLNHVWKVTPDGKKTIAVPGVHTHELYMDAADDLFGQHSIYSGEATNRWSHYIWRLRANGILDTVKGVTEGFFIENYSFARDTFGNMYWVQHWKEDRIVKTSAQGTTTVLATGNFKQVQWLLPVADRVYFVCEDGIYYIDRLKTVTTLARNLSNKQEAHNTLFGLWTDAAKNVYVANTQAHKIQKISPDGVIADYYISKGNWSPTGGLFDNNGHLWILEYNTKNEARVHNITKPVTPVRKQTGTLSTASLLLLLSVIGIVAVAVVFAIKK